LIRIVYRFLAYLKIQKYMLTPVLVVVLLKLL
jgi:hypothetical protein